MGVESTDCRKIAELIGVKVMINEFVAFEQLAVLTDNTGEYCTPLFIRGIHI